MFVLRDFSVHNQGTKCKVDTGSQQPEGFYDEILEDFSRNIHHLLRNLMMNITAANTIYPVNDRPNFF
ncbi:MAG: hypothetical protein LBB80_06100 [Treponema sp.]|nr:hypothetical protein [Treponema sp.]